jgi:hypothetical protein
MRIISKFKDYYDGAHGWYDPEPVYVRNNQKYEWKDLSKEVSSAMGRVSGLLRALPKSSFTVPGAIAFCGKVYPYFALSSYFSGSFSGFPVFYSPAKIEAFLQKEMRRDFTLKESCKEKIAHLNNKRIRRWGYDLSHVSWKRFLEDHDLSVSSRSFRAVRSPIFLIEGKTLIVNPMLRKYNFACQVDPYTAMQEISMYVGNDLVDQMDPNLNRTDDMVRDSKGFNEWSFRRHKDESKKNRKK